MTEWRIKEISDLTQTSVRMLRHYDKLGLLKPSYRAANGYRCYTANDLAKLQQIIALKYFGFSLGAIKAILQKHQNIYAHLQAQMRVLQEQSKNLKQVNEALGDVLKRLSPSKTPNWNDLITLIEGYRMSENLRDKLKKSWAGQKLTEDQFEEYLFLYEQFPKEFAERDKLFEKINQKKFGSPSGKDGEKVILFMYELARKMKKFSDNNVKLSSSLMQSIQSGKLTQLELTPEGLVWVSQATLAHWLKRWDALYEGIIENMDSDPKGKAGKKMAGEWTGLIDEHFALGSRALSTGLILWQEFARQDHELKSYKKAPTPQEMVKQCHIKIIFNPEALSWINRALAIHSADS